MRWPWTDHRGGKPGPVLLCDVRPALAPAPLPVLLPPYTRPLSPITRRVWFVPMSLVETRTAWTLESFERFARSRDEPAWLGALRRQAWERFVSAPMPDRSHEEWRRTDLRTFRFERFAFPGGAASGAVVPPAMLAQQVARAGRLVTLDGVARDQWLDPRWEAAGVRFGSLEDLVRHQPEKLRPYLEPHLADMAGDKFASLHAALWSGGTLLFVPRGVRVDEPLYSLMAISPGGSDFGHTLVVLEEGAEATLICEHAGGGDAPGLHCGATQVVVGPGAKLRLVHLQDWGKGVWHFAHQRAVVQGEAQLQWTLAALGSRLAKLNQYVALAGPGAEVQVNGVMFAEGRQHLACHTFQHHQAPGGKSDLLYKGALQDRAHVVWRGMIRVDRDAQKTDGYQRDDNLLLSETARVDSIPGLEILADDVKCTHGATAGRVEDEMIFYAQSRGLSRREAVRLVVAGFFQQVFDRITIDRVREALEAAIGQRVRDHAEAPG